MSGDIFGSVSSGLWMSGDIWGVGFNRLLDVRGHLRAGFGLSEGCQLAELFGGGA